MKTETVSRHCHMCEIAPSWDPWTTVLDSGMQDVTQVDPTRVNYYNYCIGDALFLLGLLSQGIITLELQWISFHYVARLFLKLKEYSPEMEKEEKDVVLVTLFKSLCVAISETRYSWTFFLITRNNTSHLIPKSVWTGFRHLQTRDQLYCSCRSGVGSQIQYSVRQAKMISF